MPRARSCQPGAQDADAAPVRPHASHPPESRPDTSGPYKLTCRSFPGPSLATGPSALLGVAFAPDQRP